MEKKIRGISTPVERNKSERGKAKDRTRTIKSGTKTQRKNRTTRGRKGQKEKRS